MRKCPKCGEMIGDNATSCFKCGNKGNVISYEEEKDLLKIKSLNSLYEYKVISLVDDATGLLSPDRLSLVLNSYASSGWRLREVIVNEVGKSTFGVGYGGISSGTNATIDTTMLILERKIKTIDEIRDEVNKRLENIHNIEKMSEEDDQSKKIRTSVGTIEDEIIAVYSSVGDVLSLQNMDAALKSKYATMDLLTYLQRLVDNDILEKNVSNYKLLKQ